MLITVAVASNNNDVIIIITAIYSYSHIQQWRRQVLSRGALPLSAITFPSSLSFWGFPSKRPSNPVKGSVGVL